MGLKIRLSFRLSQVCEVELLYILGSYNVQKNSFNSTSNKSQILIVRHLRRIVPRPKERSCINETGRSQGHVQNSLRECLYINFPDPLSPTPSNSPAVKTLGYTEEDPSDY